MDALRGQFTHMALLGYGMYAETIEWHCGGALISRTYILTAGHCGYHSFLGPVKHVGLGMLKRSDPKYYWRNRKVIWFIPHPQYRAPSKYHDIALIKTEDDYGSFYTTLADFRPACLDHEIEYEFEDDFAFVTGWGDMGWRMPPADVMQYVVLQQIDAVFCAKLYPHHRHLHNGYDHTTQMCYGHYEDVRDTCGGDSGSPLQKQSLEDDCLYVIIGVTSYGHGCGTNKSASVYTRVAYYVHWIEDIINDNH